MRLASLPLILWVFLHSNIAFSSSLAKLDSANSFISARFQLLQSLGVSQQELITNLLTSVVDGLDKENEYTLWAVVYKAYLNDEEKANVAKLWKEILSQYINNQIDFSSLRIQCEHNLRTYAPAIKVLLLKLMDKIFEIRPRSKQQFLNILRNLAGDRDSDISKLANLIMDKKHEFIPFLIWAQTPANKRDSLKAPYFSCSFYTESKFSRSKYCYSTLRYNFNDLLKEKDYTVNVIKDESVRGWTKVSYFAKSNSPMYYDFKFMYESEITPNGKQGYAKIYVLK